MSTKASRWSLATVAAVTLTLLAVYPVLHLRLLRGKDWNGSFAYLQGDELIYSRSSPGYQCNPRPRRY